MRKKKSERRHAAHRRTETPRAQMERTLGRKLLRGQIPVVPPSQLPRCPVPPTHVKEWEQCCRDYADGKITEVDVASRVSTILKGLKKPPEESRGEQESER